MLQAPNVGGLRRDDLIAKDGDQAGVDRRMSEYRAWQTDRAAAVARASAPGIVSHTATDLARDRTLPQRAGDVPIVVIDLPRVAGRPFGPRFGSLVHATLATVALDADADAVLQIARTHARVLLADDGEVAAAAEAVTRRARAPALRTGPRRERGRPLRARVPAPLARARRIARRGHGRRRVRRGDALTVMDFKTDREPSDLKDQYERQLTLYCRAFAALRGRRVSGVLVRV